MNYLSKKYLKIIVITFSFLCVIPKSYSQTIDETFKKKLRDYILLSVGPQGIKNYMFDADFNKIISIDYDNNGNISRLDVTFKYSKVNYDSRYEIFFNQREPFLIFCYLNRFYLNFSELENPYYRNFQNGYYFVPERSFYYNNIVIDHNLELATSFLYNEAQKELSNRNKGIDVKGCFIKGESESGGSSTRYTGDEYEDRPVYYQDKVNGTTYQVGTERVLKRRGEYRETESPKTKETYIYNSCSENVSYAKFYLNVWDENKYIEGNYKKVKMYYMDLDIIDVEKLTGKPIINIDKIDNYKANPGIFKLNETYYFTSKVTQKKQVSSVTVNNTSNNVSSRQLINDNSSKLPTATRDVFIDNADAYIKSIIKKGNAAYDAKNYQEALRFFRLAAAKGYAVAENYIGYQYYKGEGVETIAIIAVKWYIKSASKGYRAAQNNIGNCLENGIYFQKDFKEAVKWYTKAALQGHALAQNNLGTCYSAGTGVEQNSVTAFYWFKKAAEQGNPYAEYNLGSALMNGVGCEKNENLGRQWMEKAERDGFILRKLN